MWAAKLCIHLLLPADLTKMIRDFHLWGGEADMGDGVVSLWEGLVSNFAKPGFAFSSLGGSDLASAGAAGGQARILPLAQPCSALLCSSLLPLQINEASLALTGGKQD